MEAHFPVSPEVLFEALADHRSASDWFGVEVEVLRGPAEGGVGLVRRIKTAFAQLDEEIVYFDAPIRMVYQLRRGLPVSFHRGEIVVRPWGETGSALMWDVVVAAPLPGVPQLLVRALRPALSAALARLRLNLARANLAQAVGAEAEGEAAAAGRAGGQAETSVVEASSSDAAQR